MRRAAVRAFRTTCQHTARGLSRTARRFPHHSHAHTLTLSLGLSRGQQLRCLASTASLRLRLPPLPAPPRTPPGHEPLHASMYVRRLSVALVSGLVGYGAYYAYQGEGAVGPVGAAGAAAGVAPAGQAFFSTKSAPPVPPGAGAIRADGTDGSAGAGAGAGAAASEGPSAAQTTRNVLVIGANELSTGTLVGEGPIAKLTDDAGRRVLEMLTPAQVTQRLRQNEASYGIGRGKGVVRYDLVQLASNDPIEDDHAETIVEVPTKSAADRLASSNTSDWMFWGVFDGHSGWTTSAKLRQSLISYVARELNETYKSANAGTGAAPPADAIDGAIKMGFLRLDDEIVNQSAQRVLGQTSKTVAAELLAPALSGSCALLSFYDSKTKLLRVACTGDSRAVLGRRTASGKWTATALSVDQTGRNPDEVARIQRQHPGEDQVIHHGRVLGSLEPARAFGDASYKWTRDVSERLLRSFFGRSPSPRMRTPPYVTAEPVVTTTPIEPAAGDFVVMATDGLWEMLTNEEAVGLVGKWIEAQAARGGGGGGGGSGGGGGGSSSMNAAWARLFGGKGKGGGGALPVEVPAADGGGGGSHGERTPIRLQQWGISPDDRNRFLVQDQNAATHLVRNALGGANEEQVAALLTLPAPFSRRYRDDLTVQVIFFGDSPASGDVAVNEEATGPAALRAKL